MNRRDTLLSLLAFAAWPLNARAQQQGKTARISVLSSGTADGGQDLLEAFRQGLRDLGYVEGRNAVIEYRDAGRKLERLPTFAGELAALKVDVIVTMGTPASLAAKQATTTIPIVFPAAGDPVSSGLVASLARPGGNVTGLSILAPGLVGKRLERLKQAVPGLTQVAVLWNRGSYGERTEKDLLAEAEAAARALGVKLQLAEVRGAGDFDRVFSEMTRGRADALLVAGGGLFNQERRRLVDLAAKHRLPAIYPFSLYVEAGGLMAYGPDIINSHRRAAFYVDKILKGAKPADLPVEQPTKFELAINLKTAKSLDITIPRSLLISADRVIQ